MIALEVLPLLEAERTKGRPPKNERTNALISPGKAATDAAKLVGVSPRYVEQAKRVAKAAPGLIAQVRAGSKTLTEAGRELQAGSAPQAGPSVALFQEAHVDSLQPIEIERAYEADEDAIRRAVAILLRERPEALGGRAA